MDQIFIKEVLETIQTGGYVMWPLVFFAFVLWFGLGYRFHAIQRGNIRSVRVLIEKYREGYKRKPKGIVDAAVIEGLEIAKTSNEMYLRRFLEDAFYKYRNAISQYRILVRTIVIIAPLAGLLGTVIGMIETFDSLTTMTMFSQGGGIAAGISQALFTTQMGLVVAVPGLVFGKILDKKEQSIDNELQQIVDILCTSKDK